MIKDVFTLSKNSWHCRLMRYLWDLDHTDFSHICPYFWLSLLNILIFIPIGILKEIARGIDKLTRESKKSRAARLQRKREESQRIEDSVFELTQSNPKFLEELVEKVVASRYSKIKSAEVPREYFEVFNRYNYHWDGKREIVELFRTFQRKYDKIYETESEERIKRLEEARKELAKMRKQQINSLVLTFKPVGKVLIVLITLLAVYLFGLLILAIFEFIYYIPDAKWNAFWRMVGIIFFGGIGLTGVVFGFKAFFLHMSTKKISPKTEEKLDKFFTGIGAGIKKFFQGIGLIFSIIGQIIKNNCPAIKWE